MPLFRDSVSLIACLLPWPLKRVVYRKVLRYQISDAASVGFSLIRADFVSLGRGARIGHLNVIRGCASVIVGDHSGIGNFNWITAHPTHDTRHYVAQLDRRPELTMGMHASITSRHYIDCTAAVSVGDYATVAGVRSQLFTHSIDLSQNIQESKGVRIGAYGFVGTSTVLLPGSALPDFSVLAAGSLLNKAHREPYGLYAGQPAARIRELPHDLAYFNRTQGFVE